MNYWECKSCTALTESSIDSCWNCGLQREHGAQASEEEIRTTLTSSDGSKGAQVLLAPLALFCWITSLFLPAMSAPQGWVLGGEFAMKALISFPLALLFAPILALAPLTNLIFLANIGRLYLAKPSESPSAGWVGGAFLFNCVVLALAGSQNHSILGDLGRYPAMWLWLLSFVLLSMAIAGSESGKSEARWGVSNFRWKLAIALASVISISGWTVRAIRFPGPTINRTVSGVEGIEIRRSGVPPRQYPLLEDGYLRQSKYKFFALDSYAHESLPSGGWIARPVASSARYVVHEVVESYRMEPEGPGRVQRSTITIHDNGELIARKTFHDGMVEDGHGWVGAIALKFVQSVLQPLPSEASSFRQRREVLASSLELPNDYKLADNRRRLQGCQSSVTLNPNDWRELRASKWSLHTLQNISFVACNEDSVLVVGGTNSEIDIDILDFDGRVISQARTTIRSRKNLTEVEAARQSKSGWRITLLSFLPGPSVDVPKVSLERFEVTLESKETD